jgi:uncharacterized peroxidase-related enzyme
MPKIEVIEYQNSEGRLREIYDDIIKSRGKLAGVHKIQSLNPESIVNHMDLYLTIMFGQSPLKRVEREMMAVVVSKANNCEYCQIHHANAVLHYWKDEEKVNQLRNNYQTLDLSSKEKALCDYAFELTTHPSSKKIDQIISKLKTEGLNDRAILDATMVIAYFNFVNRIVLSLGVNLEEDNGTGYNYN